jgi:hypothetical protein
MQKLILILLIPFFSLFSQPLTGTKTIGPTGDYITFQEAVTALASDGVGTGGVVFNVQPGIYQERISIPAITGTSAANQVLFYGAGAATIKGTGTSATTDAMVTVTACDYITFDGINVEDGGTSTADQVELGWLITGTGTKGSTFITIQNSSVTMGGGTPYPPTASRGIVIRSAATAVEGANNNNLINNVTINKTSWGIQLAGKANISGQPTFPDFYNEIRNCRLGSTSRIGHFSNSSSIGMSIASQKAVKVTGNTIDSVITTTATAPILPVSISGISVDNASGEISYNKIHNIKYYGPGGSSPNGIRISIIENDTMKIFNNFISGIFKSEFTPPADNSTYTKGIWLFKQTGGGGTALAYYNTIFMEGETPVSYASVGFYLAASSAGTSFAVLKNNIIINNIIPTNAVANPYGNSAYAVIDGNTARTSLISNNNLLFVADTAAYIGQIGRLLGTSVVNAKTFEEWQTISEGDSQSVSKPVTFDNAADGDLHLAGSSVGDTALTAVPVSWITDDIDGENRHPVTPYMGADEDMIPVPVQLSSFTAVQNGGSVVLTWITVTEVNTLGFEVEKSSNNNVFNKIAFVKGSGSSTEIKEYIFTDNSEAGAAYYRLKMIDLDGSFEYSPSVEVSGVNVNSYTLDQNYPNPFNPSTVISYNIPVDGFVKLAVYNSLGEEVALLVNENLNAGSYNVEFKGKNLSSGIYFYKLQAGDFTIVKKMMMLK